LERSPLKRIAFQMRGKAAVGSKADQTRWGKELQAELPAGRGLASISVIDNKPQGTVDLENAAQEWGGRVALISKKVKVSLGGGSLSGSSEKREKKGREGKSKKRPGEMRKDHRSRLLFYNGGAARGGGCQEGTVYRGGE